MATKSLCSIPDCGKSARTRGLCAKHYWRLLKHGDPLKTVKISNGEAVRFYQESVATYDGEECLMWPYATIKGYASFRLDGKHHYVSRLVCEKENGPPPTPEHHAAHSCGKGHLGCVTKSHLSWKTPTDNQQDRKQHGTYQYGNLNPGSKLSEDDVRTIRKLKGEKIQREIADMFNVSRELIGCIHRGTAWGWLPD